MAIFLYPSLVPLYSNNLSLIRIRSEYAVLRGYVNIASSLATHSFLVCLLFLCRMLSFRTNFRLVLAASCSLCILCIIILSLVFGAYISIRSHFIRYNQTETIKLKK
eukprot:Rmarinus@m.17382